MGTNIQFKWDDVETQFFSLDNCVSPYVSSLSNGGFIITASCIKELSTVIFNASGNQVGPLVSVPKGSTFDSFNSVGLSNGEWALVWEVREISSTTFFFARFNERGMVLTNTIAITRCSNPVYPYISPLQYGMYLVMWSTCEGAINYQIMETPFEGET